MTLEEFIQAIRDNKEVQYKHKENDKWYDCDGSDEFSLYALIEDTDFRLKDIKIPADGVETLCKVNSG